MDNKFYKIEKHYKMVSKEEFMQYLKDYPRKLDGHVSFIGEPPYVTYNDDKLGEYPDGIVASTYIYEENLKDPYYTPEEERKYRILESCIPVLVQ